jgi:hypothetical protein
MAGIRERQRFFEVTFDVRNSFILNEFGYHTVFKNIFDILKNIFDSAVCYISQ